MGTPYRAALMGTWLLDDASTVMYSYRAAGRKVVVVEVGVQSGGSVGMWLDYFGGPEHVQ
jgi:hypothetical protein